MAKMLVVDHGHWGYVATMAWAHAEGAAKVPGSNAFGVSTRYGNMRAQMRNHLDQTGPLCAKNALVGKGDVARIVRDLVAGRAGGVR
jgi:hypothetical protein